jgi:hypothetical protein
MPRDGSLTPADLIGKIDVLRVEREKGGRTGRYPVAKLAETIGPGGKLVSQCASVTAKRSHRPTA